MVRNLPSLMGLLVITCGAQAIAASSLPKAPSEFRVPGFETVDVPTPSAPTPDAVSLPQVNVDVTILDAAVEATKKSKDKPFIKEVAVALDIPFKKTAPLLSKAFHHTNKNDPDPKYKWLFELLAVTDTSDKTASHIIVSKVNTETQEASSYWIQRPVVVADGAQQHITIRAAARTTVRIDETLPTEDKRVFTSTKIDLTAPTDDKKKPRVENPDDSDDPKDEVNYVFTHLKQYFDQHPDELAELKKVIASSK